MRRTFAGTFVLLSSVAYGQGVTLQADRLNQLYAGIDNPITVGTDPLFDSVVLTTDNGTVLPGDPGHYTAKPAHEGDCRITALSYRRGKAKDTDTFFYKVKPMPPLTLSIAGRIGGDMPLQVAREAIGISAHVEGVPFDARCWVTHFTYIVVRGKDTLVNAQVANRSGARFADNMDVHLAIKKLKRGDILVIKDIDCIGFYEGRRKEELVYRLI